jgi:hypothetical protein
MNSNNKGKRVKWLVELYGGTATDYDCEECLENIIKQLSEFIDYQGDYIQTTTNNTAPRYWRINHIQSRTAALQKAIIHYHILKKDIIC